jgi:hypothetical protein
MIDGSAYLCTCYYLDKISAIRNNELSLDKPKHKIDILRFIADASAVPYVIDSENIEQIIRIYNIKETYEVYISDSKYNSAVHDSLHGDNKAISNYYKKTLILYINKFLKNKTIYFPHFCDFR